MNRVTFELTDEQRELVSMAHAFAESELRPRARQLEERWELPRDLVEKAMALGLATYAIPEQYGGGGVDAVTAAMIMEELSWGDAGLATLIDSAHLFAGGMLTAGGDQAQREEWLGRICSAPAPFGAIAFSEPHAGSDLASIAMTATRDGDAWVLRGEKTWITAGGAFADAILVFARTGGEGASGISAFIVEGSRPGVSCTKLDLLGFGTGYTGSIFFDDVRIPAAHLVGAEGDGFAISMRFFLHSRPQVAAAAVGVARAAYEYAVAYANERTAFGKPIIVNQGVSFLLADMGMRIEAARALTWKACDASNRGVDPGLIGSYAKAFASDVAMSVTTDAVQVMGGAGLSADHPVGRFMRDAKVLQIVEGTNQVQRHIAARYYSKGVTATP